MSCSNSFIQMPSNRVATCSMILIRFPYFIMNFSLVLRTPFLNSHKMHCLSVMDANQDNYICIQAIAYFDQKNKSAIEKG